MSEKIDPAAPAPATFAESHEGAGLAPHPGSPLMPRWGTGELGEAPRFAWRKWPLLLGPGLVMGASAIGGGEWLTGPLNTARYGPAILWLATLSILGQTLYNIEISRYTLYSGEPIFTGKFRTLPGPRFWLPLYLVLDFGSFLPYLASNAAIPLVAILLGRVPNPEEHAYLLRGLACAVFVGAMIPLVIGGKIYNSIKVLMTFKLCFVFGFLMILAFFFSTPTTWWEIGTGFFRFGDVPVASPDSQSQVANLFAMLLAGEGLPTLELSAIGFLAAMAAISGNGGLTNTPISNYTRDQGWGMGGQVGAIPSILGGHAIELSHVGKVFHVTRTSLVRWKGWLRHVQREQLAVWMPACFFGIALPSMLSVQFLERGTIPPDKYQAAAMTAGGVQEAVGAAWGSQAGTLFWYLTLFCGFLILATSSVSTADGVLRRWVDVFWTASPRLQKWDTRHIGKFYFSVLLVYATCGLTMLLFVKGDKLLVWSTCIYNYALGFSCWHAAAINSVLLPRELRPSWLRRGGLIATGVFFMLIAVLTTYAEVVKLLKPS